jgi:sugar phosphate isomerase/epimerase
MSRETGELSRREFTRTAALAAGALGAAHVFGPAGAEPAAGEVKVGLYSITYLGVWYRGAALTLEQVIERAKQYGYEGVEIDGKRPHGNPLDWPRDRCQGLWRYARDRGVEIYAVAANNDFSSPIPEHREAQLAYLRELVRMTADFGAKTLRVFLAWPGVTLVREGGGRYDIAKAVWQKAHEAFSPEETWDWCREGLVESARYAGEHGVTLALQNHAPVINDYRDVLRMVREVGSPHLKACFDARLEHGKDDEYIRKATVEVGALQALSHYGGEYRQGPAGIEVIGGEQCLAEVRGLLEIGYRGYFGYELCHPLPVVDGRTVGVEYVHENARLAAEYMHGVIAEAMRLQAAGRY